ncbi:MAG: Asp-tRNA(Asn)/Glu-tRNA(Gln) amidotransferase subunit GatA [Paracoccaceae bacterium]
MSRPASLTIAEAGARLASGDLTAVALAEDCLDAAREAAPLNAFVRLAPERALAMAEDADRRRAAGEDGPLLGVPLGVKDLYCVDGVPSQAASRILDGFVPPYESTVTRKLWDAGAVMLGKLNMDEFGMGSSNENSVYGPAISPWRREGDAAEIVPGGSSGGSAAAVAADLCLGATATDTGGSIRQPSAFCGVVGIKPTYGRCSRWGIMAFASSLDQAGPIAKTVEDAAILLGAMAGHDPQDSTSVAREVPDFTAGLAGDLRGRRIGVPREYREGLADETAALLDRGVEMVRDAGAEVVEVSLPHTAAALPAYYIVAPAEASSNLARYDGVRYGRRAALRQGEGVLDLYERTRAEGFGPEVKRRVMIGAYVLSAGYYDAYYLRAQKVRRLVKGDFEAAFGEVDTLLCPATPGPAFARGEFSDDPVAMYQQDVFTVPLNLAGLPGVSVPAGRASSGLPLGLQLIAPAWEEAALLGAAAAIEARAGTRAAPERWW